MVLEGFTVTFADTSTPIRFGYLPEIPSKETGMLEISETNARDKDSEESKRKKAKLLRKLKEQEGLVNANKQVMVRDRRRPKKSIKEMSVLNKRRRVIKNTARKEIAQQRATLENMRHIELKKYSLEARELELFVERVKKVNENKRLTMLFAKFKAHGFQKEENNEDDSSTSKKSENSENGRPNREEDYYSDIELPKTANSSKNSELDGSESMSDLIMEINKVSALVDLDNNPNWRFIMTGSTVDSVASRSVKFCDDNGTKGTEAKKEVVSEKKQDSKSGPIRFGGGFGGGFAGGFGSGGRIRPDKTVKAIEAPAELQSINRFPDINKKQVAKDDSDIDKFSGIRRCISQPNVNPPGSRNIKSRKASGSSEFTTSMSTLNGDIISVSRSSTPKSQKLNSQSKVKEEANKKKVDQNSWREREKRGEALYSPVALSPIQSGLFSPDFIMEEDELTANYRKQLNPKRFQTGITSSGDMEFKQAMDKMPQISGPKNVGYQGTESIVEMQLQNKTKKITDKVNKVRAETMGANRSGAKNVAKIIHQQGDGGRFIEEVKMLRAFAALCNCKYLRTDPDKVEERRQQYIDDLVGNVSRRVQIKKRWRLPMMRLKAGGQSMPSLPVISQGHAQ